jgi:hypothetical protein
VPIPVYAALSQILNKKKENIYGDYIAPDAGFYAALTPGDHRESDPLSCRKKPFSERRRVFY